MAKYFTSLDLVNNEYIGKVYDANTNKLLYETKPHPSQTLASNDITYFLQTNNPSKESNINTQTKTETIVNTITYQPVPGQTGGRRCCGRR